MLTIIISAVGAVVVGFGVSYMLTQKLTATKRHTIIKEAEVEAELLKKERILQAKEKYQELKANHEREVASRNQKVAQNEQRIQQQTQQLNKKNEEFSRKEAETEALRKNLTSQLDIAKARNEELGKARQQHIDKLSAIAGMSVDDAKSMLMENIKAEAQTQAMSYINEVVDEAKMTATKEARRIVVQTLQRVAAEASVDTAVTVFHIENDDIKGRIIGREGRNIRTLEAATGVEIVVDDTPVLCGGSGLYIDAAVNEYAMPKVPEDAALRASLAQQSTAQLIEKLQSLRKLHNTSDTTSRKRLIRAIEIAMHSQNVDIQQVAPLPNVYVGIIFDRETRRKRITERLMQRLRSGMVEEVRGLIARGIPTATLCYYGLEYKYITEYLLQKLTYQQMIDSLNTAIHQFAKRQMTWFRGMERRGAVIHWIDGNLALDKKLAVIERIMINEIQNLTNTSVPTPNID
ncbi:hypothetical protein FACS189467_6160 [Bacteroidia bacterium]|nr:hypothetical protein FACS189467_6160 [Bacteroidia bacterium]